MDKYSEILSAWQNLKIQNAAELEAAFWICDSICLSLWENRESEYHIQ